MSTSNVNTTSPGSSPFVVDVTACNLLSDLTIKDFQIFISGVLDCEGISCSDWTKTTATQLTYNGSVIPSGTPIQIRRKTPNNQVKIIQYANRFASGDYNNEIDRIIRWREEADLNGVGPGSAVTVAIPNDGVYPTGWDGDTIQPPTRNAVYDALQLFAPLASPPLTGIPTAPTASDTTNDNQIATTAFTHTRVSNALANSPVLGGNPTATTVSDTTNNNQIATTAFVHTRVSNALANSPDLGGDPTATTQALIDNSNRIATTAFVQSQFRPSFRVVKTIPQNDNNGSVTITWDFEEYDTDNAFSDNTFTVPPGMGGKYLFGASALVNSTTTNPMPGALQLNISDSKVIRLAQYHNNSSTSDWILTGTILVSLVDNDTVRAEINDFGVSGVDINIKPDNSSTTFWGFRVGA